MDKDTEIKSLQGKIKKLTKLQSIRSDIVSTSAHQIRTSLSAIKWAIKMFINKDLGKLNPEQENLSKKIYENNDKAIDIVTELLQTNKTENVTEKPYAFTAVNLIELIESFILYFSEEASGNKVGIIFLKPETKLPIVNIDKDKFSIVLQNLLENAIKYSKPNSKIFVALKEKKDSIEISVKDSGIGISKEGKKNIFKKFYRDITAQKKETIGSGIGLFIAKKIVENHNGKMYFESNEDVGTTFFIIIPKVKTK